MMKKAAPGPAQILIPDPAAIFRDAQRAALQFKAMEQQYAQQLRPSLQVEYHFLRSVCGLTKEQRKQVARAGERALKNTATKLAETRQPLQVGPRGPHAGSDAQRLMRDGLVEAAKAYVSAEQLARYWSEVEQRDESRKQTAVRNLVAKLDQDLVLSTEQRDRIAESLSAHWHDAWGRSLELYVQGDQFIPGVPDECVTPYLNETQKRVWATTQQSRTVFGVTFVSGVVLEATLEDAELGEPPKPAPVRALMK
jgi:hypothetical protein